MADEIIGGIEEECVRRLGERKMRHFEELVKEVSGVLQENREQG